MEVVFYWSHRLHYDLNIQNNIMLPRSSLLDVDAVVVPEGANNIPSPALIMNGKQGCSQGCFFFPWWGFWNHGGSHKRSSRVP